MIVLNFRDSSHSYPLVALEMDRQACQQYIRSVGEEVPLPSNCKMCPFLSEEELEYIRRFEPEALRQWVVYEQNKLDKWKHLDRIETITSTGKKKIENKNFGVWGKKYLPEMIKIVEKKFKNWTDEQIVDYRMSHGHCVASTF